MAQAELEPVQEFNARWNLREFARGQRMEFESNRLEGYTHAQFLPKKVEEMAEEFPELELNPYQKKLVWGSLGAMQKRIFETAMKERDSGPGPDHDENYIADSAVIASTLLQVYSFLHGLEAYREKAA